MVTREQESKLRNVIRQHIDKAIDELSELEVVSFYWPDGYAERMAEAVVQMIAFGAEVAELTEENA